MVRLQATCTCSPRIVQRTSRPSRRLARTGAVLLLGGVPMRYLYTNLTVEALLHMGRVRCQRAGSIASTASPLHNLPHCATVSCMLLQRRQGTPSEVQLWCCWRHAAPCAASPAACSALVHELKEAGAPELRHVETEDKAAPHIEPGVTLKTVRCQEGGGKGALHASTCNHTITQRGRS